MLWLATNLLIFKIWLIQLNLKWININGCKCDLLVIIIKCIHTKRKLMKAASWTTNSFTPISIVYLNNIQTDALTCNEYWTVFNNPCLYLTKKIISYVKSARLCKINTYYSRYFPLGESPIGMRPQTNYRINAAASLDQSCHPRNLSYRHDYTPTACVRPSLRDAVQTKFRRNAQAQKHALSVFQLASLARRK